ncbi:MAG TPA: hypothetical protein VGG32_06935 [Thermoplasmata archaeon]|jgi:hypothetical protein
MAVVDSRRSRVPAFGPVKVPAFGPLASPNVKVIGIVAALFATQAFVWLGTVVVTNTNGSSPILPGSWSGYSNQMLFYLITMLFSMILIGYTTDLSLVPKYKDVSRFLINYGLWTFVSWLALSLIYPGGPGVAALTGTDRIQTLVFISLFVAPAEELLFRVVLPRLLNSWILGSVVLFSGYHFAAYLVSYSSESLIVVATGLIEVAILGVVLWFIYSFVFRVKTRSGAVVAINSGYGGSTGFHAAWDLFVSGVLPGLPI